MGKYVFILRAKFSLHPKGVTKYRIKGTELCQINRKYHLYRYKRIYEDKKNPRKISGDLVGSITEIDGLVPSLKLALETAAHRA